MISGGKQEKQPAGLEIFNRIRIKKENKILGEWMLFRFRDKFGWFNFLYGSGLKILVLKSCFILFSDSGFEPVPGRE